MSKKQNKTKRWIDLKQYKKKIPVYHEDELLFELQEMSDKEFAELLQLIKDKGDNFDVNSVEFIASALRKIVLGVDFDGLTDQEIIDELEQMGESVISSINQGLKEFVIDRMIRFSENLKNVAEDLKKINKIDNVLDKTEEAK